MDCWLKRKELRMRIATRTLGWAIVIGVTSGQGACTGRIAANSEAGNADESGGAGGHGGDVPPDDVVAIPVSKDCPQPDVGFGRLRRLTKSEYNRTVRDVLGDDTRPAEKFVSDEREGSFYVNGQATITETIYTQYEEAAEAVAGRFVARAGSTTCAGGATVDAELKCTQTFLDDVGARLYRRMLKSEEKQTLVSIYTATRKAGTHSDGVRQILQTMLQSPFFLYHTELGVDSAGASVVKLSGFELASRLSFLFWGTSPDQSVLQAAAKGDLDTPEGIAKQASLMLKNSKTIDRINDFYSQWLRLDRLDHFISKEDLRAATRDETLAFLRMQYEKPQVTLTNLLTSRDAELVPLTRDVYFPGATSSPTTLDSKTRAGILTRAAFIAASHNVPARGKFIWNELLCNDISLPADLDTTLAEPKPGENPRQRFDRHRESASCRGCHMILDPPGHTFWHYDEVGRYRTKIGDWQIDASGALAGTEGSDGPVYGAVELSEKLAKVPEVAQCMVRQWFRFALGREPDDVRDACSLQKAQQIFAERGGDLKTIAVIVAQSDAFRFRRNRNPTNLSPGKEAQP